MTIEKSVARKNLVELVVDIGDYKKQLDNYFVNEPVAAVYLFGSWAKGQGTERSDVDIGILFEENVGEDESEDLRIKYMTDLPGVVQNRIVDVVNVQKLPLPFQYKIVAQRGEAGVKDRERMIEFERKVVKPFLDFKIDYDRVVKMQMGDIAKEGFTNA